MEPEDDDDKKLKIALQVFQKNPHGDGAARYANQYNSLDWTSRIKHLIEPSASDFLSTATAAIKKSPARFAHIFCQHRLLAAELLLLFSTEHEDAHFVLNRFKKSLATCGDCVAEYHTTCKRDFFNVSIERGADRGGLEMVMSDIHKWDVERVIERLKWAVSELQVLQDLKTLRDTQESGDEGLDGDLELDPTPRYKALADDCLPIITEILEFPELLLENRVIDELFVHLFLGVGTRLAMDGVRPGPILLLFHARKEARNQVKRQMQKMRSKILPDDLEDLRGVLTGVVDGFAKCAVTDNEPLRFNLVRAVSSYSMGFFALFESFKTETVQLFAQSFPRFAPLFAQCFLKAANAVRSSPEASNSNDIMRLMLFWIAFHKAGEFDPLYLWQSFEEVGVNPEELAGFVDSILDALERQSTFVDLQMEDATDILEFVRMALLGVTSGGRVSQVLTTVIRMVTRAGSPDSEYVRAIRIFLMSVLCDCKEHRKSLSLAVVDGALQTAVRGWNMQSTEQRFQLLEYVQEILETDVARVRRTVEDLARGGMSDRLELHEQTWTAVAECTFRHPATEDGTTPTISMHLTVLSHFARVALLPSKNIPHVISLAVSKIVLTVESILGSAESDGSLSDWRDVVGDIVAPLLCTSHKRLALAGLKLLEITFQDRSPASAFKKVFGTSNEVAQNLLEQLKNSTEDWVALASENLVLNESAEHIIEALAYIAAVVTPTSYGNVWTLFIGRLLAFLSVLFECTVSWTTKDLIEAEQMIPLINKILGLVLVISTRGFLAPALLDEDAMTHAKAILVAAARWTRAADDAVTIAALKCVVAMVPTFLHDEVRERLIKVATKQTNNRVEADLRLLLRKKLEPTFLIDLTMDPPAPTAKLSHSAASPLAQKSPQILHQPSISKMLTPKHPPPAAQAAPAKASLNVDEPVRRLPYDTQSDHVAAK
ncbi:hypothetical protein HDU93_007692, partial [Gonapodya sp. JEL0774]